MKQAKKNKEHRLNIIQARELCYRFSSYKDNISPLVLTKEMSREKCRKAFIDAISLFKDKGNL